MKSSPNPYTSSFTLATAELPIPVAELLVVRRRLTLHAEWLRDRLRLFSAAVGVGKLDYIRAADLGLALDGKLTVDEAVALLQGELQELGHAAPDEFGWQLN